MKQKLLATSLCACLALSAVAQTPIFNTERKLDGKLEKALRERTLVGRGSNGKFAVKALGTDAKLGVLINSSDAPSLAAALEAEGLFAHAVSDYVLTAEVPVERLQELAARKDVYYVQSPRKFRPLLNTTRTDIKADKVAAGEALETPFDGTGVLVAVIDQGFQPKHIAFNNEDGTSRVKQYWNRRNYERQKNTKPSATVPNGGDNIPAYGHATHVTGIAAGSDVGNGLQGIAPKASLYMIPSSFDEDEMLQDIQTIAAYAKTQGMPYVVNLSLGSQMGPHDGTTLYDQTLSAIIDQGGGFICAAMGNEGDQKIHASHTFATDGETRSVLVRTAGDSDYYCGMIWESAGDGQEHVSFKPFYYVSGQKTYLTEVQKNSVGYIEDGIDSYNGKHYFVYQIPYNSIRNLGGSTSTRFGVEMTGNTGDEIHAWVEADMGEFQSGTGFLTGNSQYLNSEGGASIPHAFGIAAYAAANTYKSAIDGYTYGGYSSGETVGRLCSFSSNGPWFGEDPRPTVAAPGLMVKSAYSSYDQYFDEEDTSITNIITKGTAKYYYGEMSGTSMSTPVATGTVALWLQANPELTYAQLLDIFRTTSRHDRYATEEWDAKYGFGKLDAYEGLKMALALANTGIHAASLNSEAPVTLLKGADAWRILFNSDESFADIALYTVSGQRVSSRHLEGVRRGAETNLSLAGLAPGAYVISIRTTAATYSRKVLVK